MGSDEFVFKLPGDPGFKRQDGTLEYDRKFPLASLDDYDQIFHDSVRTWEANVRRGWVLLYRVSQKGEDNNPRPVSLGMMPVEDVRRKFG